MFSTIDVHLLYSLFCANVELLEHQDNDGELGI